MVDHAKGIGESLMRLCALMARCQVGLASSFGQMPGMLRDLLIGESSEVKKVKWSAERRAGYAKEEVRSSDCVV